MSLSNGWPLASEAVQRCTLQLQISGERYHWAYEAVWHHDIEPCVLALRQPVLLLCGVRDVGYASIPEFARRIRDVRQVTIEDAGALVADEQTEQYCDAIFDFVGAPVA